MDIVPVLNLNRHPRDCEDCSLIDAENVMLSLDQSVLVTEPSIVHNKTITDTIETYYTSILNSANTTQRYSIFNARNEALYKIIDCIECSDELVIFVGFRRDELTNITVADKNLLEELYNRAVIFRYRTTDDNCKVSYNKNGGIRIGGINTNIKGTFTYNVENALIIAIAEYYDDESMIPLRTINLGQFNSSVNNEYSDLNTPDELLSISPEIYLPNIINQTYIKGSANKGWYYFFIRLKINKVDYTQWFPFGFPIYIDNIEEVNIIKYGFNQSIYADRSYAGYSREKERRIFPSYEPVGFVSGCTDYISNKSDVATITAKFNIEFNHIDKLSKLYGNNNVDGKFTYQIGFVCSSKSYTKSYRTYDILNNDINEFIINHNNLIEVSSTELINDNNNYYNVKNITNYKNKLYIANYKENNINAKIIDEALKNVNLSCERYQEDNDDDFKYNIGLIKISTDTYVTDPTNPPEDESNGSIFPGEGLNNNKQSFQFDCDVFGKIKLTTFLNISNDTIVYINNAAYIAEQVFIRKREFQYDIKNAKDESGNDIKATEQTYGSEIEFGTTTGTDPIRGKVTIKYGDNTTVINTDQYIALIPIPYINTKNTFEKRIKGATLIPGEIYNFYIHFIDKYGQFTNGYRINNKQSHIYNGNEVICFKFKSYYVSFPKDNNVAENGKLNLTGIKFHHGINPDGTIYGEYTGVDVASKRLEFSQFYTVFSKEEYNTVKWYQVTDVPYIDSSTQKFGYFENNNGEGLFKVPDYYTTTINKINLGLRISGVNIPEGYIGFFISYEKMETRQLITGLLTNSDFRTNHYRTFKTIYGSQGQQQTISDIMFSPLNFRNSNKMYFYSSQLDISDKLKFDYSIIKLREARFTVDKYRRYWQQSPFFMYPKDYNKPILTVGSVPDYYPIPKYKLAVAESAQDSRMGLSTCIELDNDYNLFGEIDYKGEYNTDIVPKMFIATLINSNKDIYMNKEKILVRCTDYHYKKVIEQDIIDYNGLNGRYTYDGVIIYDGHGISFNDATKKVEGINNMLPFYPDYPAYLAKTSDGTESNIADKFNSRRYDNDQRSYKSSFDAYTPFMNYVQFGLYSNIMFESKSFNNAPKGEVFPIYSPGTYRSGSIENNPSSIVGCMVTPKNSLDLFENRQGAVDVFNPKTYINYREDFISIDFYDKTIRRSNVIQDESRINGWRTFALESYKNITENKGKITNLYGVGTIFLVHTEHSMFMFNIDNTMKTEDKTVQLYQPDTFEVDYKEVLTSDLGYGGLQDDRSWIADQFGYIFYNEDINRFFIFDNNQLGNPDEEIIEFLNKYRPYRCRFFNDKERHRLLIKLLYRNNNREKSIIMSFNYITKKFICRHTYHINNGYNTKVDSFILFNNGIKDAFYQFVQDSSSYSNFENIPIEQIDENEENPYFIPAKLRIVINTQYDLVKYIEYIVYKLYKINAAKNDDEFSPVEERITPFSGVMLRVYNDQIDTGPLDILIDSEISKNVFANYTKPYWDLGNWNFNYLRNTLESSANDITSRLFGNWFVVELVINDDNNKVEFENLKINLSKDKLI